MDIPSFREQQKIDRMQKYSLRRAASVAVTDMTKANHDALVKLQTLDAYGKQHATSRPPLTALRLDMVGTTGMHRRFFPELEEYKFKLQETKKEPLRFDYSNKTGNGIIFVAGGYKYLTNVFIAMKTIRHLGCTLPIELWYLGNYEMPEPFQRAIKTIPNVEFRNAEEQANKGAVHSGWQLKSYAMINSRFENLIFFDADTCVHIDPTPLFDSQEFKDTGAIFWPDIRDLEDDRLIWEICGLKPLRAREVEAGQMMLNTKKNGKALETGLFMNEHAEFFYRHLWGDKDTMHMAWRMYDAPFLIMPRYQNLTNRGRFVGLRHLWTDDKPFVDHRIHCKWDLGLIPQVPVDGSNTTEICEDFMNELRFLLSSK